MKLSRRRFLTISASCLAAGPVSAATARWQGRAFGAECEITLRGLREATVPALEAARLEIRRMEELFSLYDPHSTLSVLNRDGNLSVPPSDFVALFDMSDRVHQVSGGLFDPTVQPLWEALVSGGDVEAARALIGWERVRFNTEEVRLGSGQAVTFNGIAQGFATDRVADVLADHGLSDTLVNIGEFRGAGGKWRIGLSDPHYGLMGTRSLHNGAIATSSPQATLVGKRGHILHEAQEPLWSTVSVEADDAATADGFSTAFCLAPLSVIRAAVGQHGIRRVTIVDPQGDLMTI